MYAKTAIRIGAVAVLSRYDVGLGIDLQQTLAHHLHFWTAHGGGEGWQLTVYVGGVDTVRIHHCQMPYPTAYQ